MIPAKPTVWLPVARITLSMLQRLKINQQPLHRIVRLDVQPRRFGAPDFLRVFRVLERSGNPIGNLGDGVFAHFWIIEDKFLNQTFKILLFQSMIGNQEIQVENVLIPCRTEPMPQERLQLFGENLFRSVHQKANPAFKGIDIKDIFRLFCFEMFMNANVQFYAEPSAGRILDIRINAQPVVILLLKFLAVFLFSEDRELVIADFI